MTLLSSPDRERVQCNAAMMEPSGNGIVPSLKALTAMSLPSCARNWSTLMLPINKCFTAISFQSRYPGGILTPKIGEALLDSADAPAFGWLSLPFCAADFAMYRMQTAMAAKLAN